MEICINLNYILIMLLILSFIIAGVIIYPILFGAKVDVSTGKVKVGFLSLWIKRIKALLSGKARIDLDIDWDYDGKIKKD